MSKPIKNFVKRPIEPALRESRICFSIAYFTSEKDADRYAEWVESCGFTYNGGFFHGMKCGRETRFDYVDGGIGQVYAVTE